MTVAPQASGQRSTLINVQGLTKTFKDPSGETIVLNDVNLTLGSGEKLVILGKPGSGKSTLLKLIAGLLNPTSGNIAIEGSVSFPVGHVGGFRRDLTVEQNISFAASLYGASKREVLQLMGDLLEIRQLSSMRWVELAPRYRREIGFALSYAIPFDCYLIDSNFVAGSINFQSSCIQLIQRRFQNAGFLFAARTPRLLGDADFPAAVIYERQLYVFPTLAEASYVYKQLPDGTSDGYRQDYGEGEDV